MIEMQMNEVLPSCGRTSFIKVVIKMYNPLQTEMSYAIMTQNW